VATAGATGSVIGESPVTATSTKPLTVAVEEPVATSVAAPLVPAGQAIFVIVGGVAPTAGVRAVADTVRVTDRADGVGTHLFTPAAVTQSERGTDGMVTGPTVVDTVASANAVPESAMQQPIAATTTGTERGVRILVTS
jgi:hypothetical protein